MATANQVLSEAIEKAQAIRKKMKEHPSFGVVGRGSWGINESNMYQLGDIVRQLQESRWNFKIEDHDDVDDAIERIQEMQHNY